MSEFASAAMLRVLRKGMQALGLDVVPQEVFLRGQETAWVDIDEKRLMVMSAVSQAGHSCLPLLGKGLHALSHEPTHAALAAARSPEDLLLRWQRLERYIHSSHRIAYTMTGLYSMKLVHQSTAGYGAPQPEESLVVMGVLAALLEAVGVSGVTVWLDTVQVYPTASEDMLQPLIASSATGNWTMDWQQFPVKSSPAPVPSGWQHHALRMFHGAPVAQQLNLLILQDVMHPPSLAQTATALGFSPRSLQRSLSQSGFSFSGMIAQCRVSAASQYLLDSGVHLAEVGFLCGFSDQPHFTRVFKRRVGITPARYRQEFG